MQVPFLDLKAQYEAIKAEIHSALQAVIDKTAFAGGPFVAEFEKAFAPFCGCTECVGVGSGTEGPLDSAAGARRRAGRRSHHRTQHLHRHGRGYIVLRRHPGLCGCGRAHGYDGSGEA